MRSKTRQISKNTQRPNQVRRDHRFHLERVSDTLKAGHRSASSLSTHDEALFRSFQSNLLSLVSHELRTPLTGILNALTVLGEGTSLPGLTSEDLIKMAQENANRLNQALATLMDLSALESGAFFAKLREVDFARLVHGRLRVHEANLKNIGVQVVEKKEESSEAFQKSSGEPVLGDPQKLSRAIDLCFEVLFPRIEHGSELQVRISSAGLTLSFSLLPQMLKLWETSWNESVAGFEGGRASPHSAFSGFRGLRGILQSEEAFLSRVEEGFGSEFLLIHEIMRLHGGHFSAHLHGDRQVQLEIRLPEMESEQGLQTVLKSRAYQLSTQLSAVSLIWLDVEDAPEAEKIRNLVRSQWAGVTDAIYFLRNRGRVAWVIDEGKPKKLERMMRGVERMLGKKVRHSIANCPSDELDPSALVAVAEDRLRSEEKNSSS